MGGLTQLRAIHLKTNMQSVNGAVVILPRNSTTEEVRQIKGQTIGFHPQTQNLEE